MNVFFFFFIISYHTSTRQGSTAAHVCVCVRVYMSASHMQRLCGYPFNFRYSFFAAALNATNLNLTQFAPCPALPCLSEDNAIISVLSCPVCEIFWTWHSFESQVVSLEAPALLFCWYADAFMQCACGYTTKRRRRQGFRTAFFPFRELLCHGRWCALWAFTCEPQGTQEEATQRTAARLEHSLFFLRDMVRRCNSDVS